MQRMLIGGVAALFMAGGGLLVWQSMANQPSLIPDPPPPVVISDKLPEAGADAPAFGPAPPPRRSRQKQAVRKCVSTDMTATGMNLSLALK